MIIFQNIYHPLEQSLLHECNKIIDKFMKITIKISGSISDISQYYKIERFSVVTRKTSCIIETEKTVDLKLTHLIEDSVSTYFPFLNYWAVVITHPS